MRDILPEEAARWQAVEQAVREVFGRYGFEEIRTPLLEGAELFERSVGQDSDIVGKEMYVFERDRERFALRPEGTAPVVRAFIEHALYRNVADGYPARYYYLGPMFRYERPQRGRQRQFHQIGVEVLGTEAPEADVETIEMLWRLLDALAVEDRTLALGSVGDETCRPRFRDTLRRWLDPRRRDLCPDCQRRYEANPLRILDCKVAEDQALLSQAPTLLEGLCAACAQHFQAVREGLERAGVPHAVDPRIVRGLDYYRRTVFEVRARSLGAQNAIAGGGRYDGLVEALGGPALPGFGFAVGIERLLMVVPRTLAPRRPPDLAIVTLGSEALEPARGLASRLRAAGLRVLLALGRRPMGAQLRRADRSGARFALFIGAGDAREGLYDLKDLKTGEQQRLSEAAIVDRLRRH